MFSKHCLPHHSKYHFIFSIISKKKKHSFAKIYSQYSNSISTEFWLKSTFAELISVEFAVHKYLNAVLFFRQTLENNRKRKKTWIKTTLSCTILSWKLCESVFVLLSWFRELIRKFSPYASFLTHLIRI